MLTSIIFLLVISAFYIASTSAQIDVRCPQEKHATISVKKNGVCYNYFMKPTYHFNWEKAGQFCRNNSLGDLPLVSTQDDKDLLASIIKSADPSASGAWIGGNMDGDLCNILLVENAHTEQWHCKIAHSFLCAVEPERLMTETELGLWCPGAYNGRATVLKNGMCYYYLKDEGNSLPWKEAGQFCRKNTLGKLPIATNPEDKALLASVIKGVDPDAISAWIGGQIDEDNCNMLLISDSDTHQKNCSIPQPFLCADAGKNPCPEPHNGVDWIFIDGKCFYVWTPKTFNLSEADNFCKTEVNARMVDPLIYHEVDCAHHLVYKLNYDNDFWIARQVTSPICFKLPRYYSVRYAACSEQNAVICVTPSEKEINLRCPKAVEGGKTFFEYNMCYSSHPEKLSLDGAKSVCQDTYNGSLPVIRRKKDFDVLRFFLISTEVEKGWLDGQKKDGSCRYIDVVYRYAHVDSCLNEGFVCEVQPKRFKTEILTNPCPEPTIGGKWVYHDHNCYFVPSYNNFTWSEATDFCKKLNAKLPDLEIPHEKSFLDSFVKKDKSLHGWDFWIGSQKEEKCKTLASTKGIDCETPNSFICVTESEKEITARCPEGKDGNRWWLKNDMCYTFVKNLMLWHQAGRFCVENFMGNLPFVPEKRRRLQNFVDIMRSVGENAVWVGGDSAVYLIDHGSSIPGVIGLPFFCAVRPKLLSVQTS